MKIVHILSMGHTLCWRPGTPDQWPDNHYWVDIRMVAEATCSECLLAYARWTASRPPDSAINGKG